MSLLKCPGDETGETLAAVARGVAIVVDDVAAAVALARLVGLLARRYPAAARLLALRPSLSTSKVAVLEHLLRVRI